MKITSIGLKSQTCSAMFFDLVVFFFDIKVLFKCQPRVFTTNPTSADIHKNSYFAERRYDRESEGVFEIG